MRTSLKLLALGTLLLPGCILVAKEDWDDDDMHPPKGALEHRVAMLEHRLDECMMAMKEGCCQCMGEEHEEGEKHGETGSH